MTIRTYIDLVEAGLFHKPERPAMNLDPTNVHRFFTANGYIHRPHPSGRSDAYLHPANDSEYRVHKDDRGVSNVTYHAGSSAPGEDMESESHLSTHVGRNR